MELAVDEHDLSCVNNLQNLVRVDPLVRGYKSSLGIEPRAHLAVSYLCSPAEGDVGRLSRVEQYVVSSSVAVRCRR